MESEVQVRYNHHIPNCIVDLTIVYKPWMEQMEVCDYCYYVHEGEPISDCPIYKLLIQQSFIKGYLELQNIKAQKENVK